MMFPHLGEERTLKSAIESKTQDSYGQPGPKGVTQPRSILKLRLPVDTPTTDVSSKVVFQL